MATTTLYNQTGKNIGTIDLDEAVFGVKVNNPLVHQVYLALEANARESWAKAKDRSEVRGGGKKPWRQKGTGRARHGSTRSPIWVGGGVTFGPVSERNYKQKINKKMNREAVRVCLSEKVRHDALIVLDDLSATGKTQEMAAVRAALPGAGKSTLLLTAENIEAIALATRNIPKFDMQQAIDVNVVDILHHEYIIATKAAIDVLTERLGA
jgi:large subunit ribosomal protein L4